MTQIDNINDPKSSRSGGDETTDESEQSATESSADMTDSIERSIRLIDDEEQSHMDEVFEAFIGRRKSAK